MANSLTFDGVDFTAYGITVLKPFFPFFSSIDASAIRLSIGDGSVSPPSKYNSRIFSVPCIVLGTSHANLLTKLDSIALNLGHREEANLSFDLLPGRYWVAKPVGLPSVSSLGSMVAELTLNFAAVDPHAYDDTENTVNSGTLPAGITVATGGTIESYPVIEATIATAPVESLVIGNDATSQWLSWVSPSSGDDLAVGDKIQIDCRPEFQTFSIWRVADSAFSVNMEGVSGIFPQLVPNTSNTITFTTITATVFSIVWRDRYQ